MEMRMAKIASNLLLLLFNSLFVDAEKFISTVRFSLRPIFCRREEETLEKSPEKIQNSDAEMGKVVDRLGITWGMGGIVGNSCLGEKDVAAVFEEEEPSFDEIKEAFRIFDGDKDGFIDGGDLHRILSDLGLKERHDLEECKRMIGAVDSDGDGLIDFHDFLKFMEKCLC